VTDYLVKVYLHQSLSSSFTLLLVFIKTQQHAASLTIYKIEKTTT